MKKKKRIFHLFKQTILHRDSPFIRWSLPNNSSKHSPPSIQLSCSPPGMQLSCDAVLPTATAVASCCLCFCIPVMSTQNYSFQGLLYGNWYRGKKLSLEKYQHYVISYAYHKANRKIMFEG